MTSSEYPDSVLEYVHDQGWTTNLTELREGAYIISGERNGGSEKMFLMVVCEPEDEVTLEHIEFLIKAGEKKDINLIRLTYTVRITEDAEKMCEKYGVDILESEKVQSHGGVSGFDIDTDEGKMPGSDFANQDIGEQQSPDKNVTVWQKMSFFAIAVIIIAIIIASLTAFTPIFSPSEEFEGILSDSNQQDGRELNSTADGNSKQGSVNTDNSEQTSPETNLDGSEAEPTINSQNEQETIDCNTVKGTDVSELSLSVNDTETNIPQARSDVLLDIDWKFAVGKEQTGVVSNLEADQNKKFVSVQWRVDITGDEKFEFDPDILLLETESAIYNGIFHQTGIPSATYKPPASDVGVQFVFEIPDSVTSATLKTKQEEILDNRVATQFNCNSNIRVRDE